VTQLLRANAAADAARLCAGPLTVPVLYVTRSGDTLDRIAAATGLPAADLLRADDTVGLNPGQVLPTAARPTRRPAGTRSSRSRR
jgi:LysM repeat protein